MQPSSLSQGGFVHRFVSVDTVVFITLDTLRYDAAQTAFQSGQLTILAEYLPVTGWEHRHSPASFTYAAHHAFFSGFLPTPTAPGPHRRLFAAAFSGSESTGSETFVFHEPTLPQALSARGWHTVCIGGTGFFNLRNPLGSVLPGFFDEAFWEPSLGVTEPDSTANQVGLAVELLERHRGQLLLFVNISAIHQPNWFYLDGGGSKPETDTLASHTAALRAVDTALAPLFGAVGQRGSSSWIICSDHGTAYGENGYVGHRHGQAVVWDVPYAEFFLA